MPVNTVMIFRGPSISHFNEESILKNVGLNKHIKLILVPSNNIHNTY
jgi:hypothetical protein